MTRRDGISRVQGRKFGQGEPPDSKSIRTFVVQGSRAIFHLLCSDKTHKVLVGTFTNQEEGFGKGE